MEWLISTVAVVKDHHQDFCYKIVFTVKSVIAIITTSNNTRSLFFQIESALSQECPLWRPSVSRENLLKRWSRTVQSLSGSGKFPSLQRKLSLLINISLSGWRLTTPSATTPRGGTGGAPSLDCRPHILPQAWMVELEHILNPPWKNKNIARIWSFISFY